MSERRALFAGMWEAATTDPVPEPAWPLPPGAAEPAVFVAKCTQCGDCADACPVGAIGPLPPGGPYGGTPALNPNKAPCLLCENMDCAKACTTGALQVMPWDAVFFGLAEIIQDKCIVFSGPECGACRPACPIGALTTPGGTPRIDAERCNGCGLCRQSCPVWDKAIEVRW